MAELNEISYCTTDFAAFGKLYVGTGAAEYGASYEVSARFDALDSLVASLATNIEVNVTGVTNLAARTEALEAGYSRINTTLTAHLGPENPQHVPDATDQDGKLLGVGAGGGLVWSDHPADMTKHLPSGGLDGQLLGLADGVAQWLTAEFNVEGEISADAIFEAFTEVTAATWTLAGRPLGTTRVRTACFAADRFLFGGDNGMVRHTFDGQAFSGTVQLFDDPVEAIVSASHTDGTTVNLAINAYSDFRIQLNGGQWSGRLSVRVASDGDGNYHDKYHTADFTRAFVFKDLIILPTTSGETFRATVDEVIAEYYRTQTEDYDRHSGVWKVPTSQFSITANMLAGCAGGEHAIQVGTFGRIAASLNGAQWEAVSSPFGASNINDIAAGEDAFLAVADDGKLGTAKFTAPKSWSLLAARPFENESIRCVGFGGGLWIIVSETGRVASSRDMAVWTERNAHLYVAGASIAYGDTFFMIGDDAGNVTRSVALARLFSVITRADFAGFIEQCETWMRQQGITLEELRQRVLDAIQEMLDAQLSLGTIPGLPGILNGEVGESGDAADAAHRHDNSDVALRVQIARAERETGPHREGIASLDRRGRVPDVQLGRGLPDGVAPLNEERLVPAEYLANGWAFDLLLQEMKAKMLSVWHIQLTTIFQDLGEYSRINGLASSKTTVVAVGEKGRIAWGPNVRQLQRATDMPFGETSLVGVVHGYDTGGYDLFLCVTKTHYSTSADGDHWTEPVEIEGDIQGVFYGGGKFLIPTADGNIYRSEWSEDGLAFIPQSTSPTITQGVRSIAFLENHYVGVGINNLVVGSDNAEHWDTEQSPLAADTQWNHVFSGDGVFVAVGNYGRMMSAQPHGTWTRRTSSVSVDLHTGCFEAGAYLVAGKNGTAISSFNATSWAVRDAKTTSTIRACGYISNQFVVATDAGQFIVSATLMEVFGLIGEQGLGPSNSDPLPLAAIAFAGILNLFSRADHQHSWEGLVTLPMVGAAHGVASLDADGVVPAEQLGKGEPNGVAPLDEAGIVPKIHLPQIEINYENIVNIINEGGQLEFVEVASPFPAGPLVSSRLLDGEYAFDKYWLCGERGIGVGTTVSNWGLSDDQPFGSAIVQGMAAGVDEAANEILVAIDTANRVAWTRDGETWSVPAALGEYDFEDICYYNRTFLILCSNGHVLRSVFTAGELIWSEQESSPNVTERLNKIRGGNGVWIGVGNDGRIRKTTDASHFEPVESPTTADLLAHCFGNGKFLFGGSGGVLFSTVFGTEFESIPNPFGVAVDITSACFEDGVYTIANYDGGIATSVDLEKWTLHDSPFVSPVRAAFGGAGHIVLGDDLGNICVSRSNIKIVGGACDGNAKLAGVIEIRGDVGDFQELDSRGLPTGTVYRNVTIIPLRATTGTSATATTTFAASSATLSVTETSGSETYELPEMYVSPKSQYQGSIPATEEEMIEWAARNNPITDVEIE